MGQRRAVCVYCGSRSGTRDIYRAAAENLAAELVARNFDLVFGGGRVGLMGALADAVLRRGGRVIGIIPGFLADREVAHHGVTELLVVPNMHERKALLAARADAFLALPGGWGTLEELYEQITWLQLGLHRKPCGVLNTAGFFDPLRDQWRRMADEGFLDARQLEFVPFDDDPARLLDRLFLGFGQADVRTA